MEIHVDSADDGVTADKKLGSIMLFSSIKFFPPMDSFLLFFVSSHCTTDV